MTPAEIIARACTPAPDECWHGSGSTGPSGGDFACHIYMWEREMPRAKAILSALTSAGIRMERDDPVTTVYGRLLWRHMDALRKGDEPRREKLFEAIEILRGEYPAECQVWEDRYDPAIRALADGGGSE